MAKVKIKFSEIDIGTPVLFNGHYARKTKSNEIQVPRLGVDGFFYISEDQEIEVIEEDNNGES